MVRKENMDYKKEYRKLGFRVIFSRQRFERSTLSFAAQPYELMMDVQLNNEPETFLVRGRVGPGEKLEVGFNGFLMEMTLDFHLRLGELYEVVKTEYRDTILKKV